MAENNLIGVVLCGGKSSRMGSDKGLLKLNDKTWAELAVKKMEQLRIPVYVSINETQVTDYTKIFEKEKLIVDNVSIEGPLRGLISCWNKFRDADIFVVACDLLDLQFSTLLRLYEEYHDFRNMPAKRQKQFFVYENNNHVEPMCAIFTTIGLFKIARLVEKGKLSDHSMRYVLTIADTHAILMPEDLKMEFRNYNTSVDL